QPPYRESHPWLVGESSQGTGVGAHGRHRRGLPLLWGMNVERAPPVGGTGGTPWTDNYASIRMDVGAMPFWLSSKLAPCPKAGTVEFTNGTRSTCWNSDSSAAAHLAQPSAPGWAEAAATFVVYPVLLMLAKFAPFGADGPDRNGTSWVGRLTVSGSS